MKNSKNIKRTFLNRLTKTLLGLGIASVLVFGPAAGYVFAAEAVTVEVKEGEQEDKEGTVVFLNGEKGSNKADGTTAEKAVATWKAAKKLVGEKGTIYISGTVVLKKEVVLELPKGVKVERAKDFKEALFSLKKGAKLTIYGEWLTEKDVDVTEAGEDAFIRLEEPKEELPEEEAPEETIPEEGEAEETVPEETVPGESIPDAPEAENPEESDEESIPGEVVKPETPDEKDEAETGKEEIKPEEPEIDKDEEGEKEPEEDKKTEDKEESEEDKKTDDKETEDEKTPEDDKKPENKEDEKDKEEIKVPEEDKKPAPGGKPEEIENPVGSLTDLNSGVIVKGDFIPSYVEVRVTVNYDVSQLPKADIGDILSAYDITLWNLKENEEYIMPEGKKALVLIPVPENTDASSLVIAHYLGKGEYEYFVMGQNMNIRDGYLEIMTASFSPFNVGGGQQIVGIGTGSGNHKPSGTTGKTKDESDSLDKIKVPDNTKPGQNTNNRTQINRNPKTGDNTEIMKYVILGGVAVILIVVVIATRKKKGDK